MWRPTTSDGYARANSRSSASGLVCSLRAARATTRACDSVISPSDSAVTVSVEVLGGERVRQGRVGARLRLPARGCTRASTRRRTPNHCGAPPHRRPPSTFPPPGRGPAPDPPSDPATPPPAPNPRPANPHTPPDRNHTPRHPRSRRRQPTRTNPRCPTAHTPPTPPPSANKDPRTPPSPQPEQPVHPRNPQPPRPPAPRRMSSSRTSWDHCSTIHTEYQLMFVDLGWKALNKLRTWLSLSRCTRDHPDARTPRRHDAGTSATRTRSKNPGHRTR